jgi:hypothetical protein
MHSGCSHSAFQWAAFWPWERFKKYRIHLANGLLQAVSLGFGFVSAQLQAAAGMLLRQSLAKAQKSSLQMAALFLETLLISGHR